jgi:hypothetical protein
MFTLSKAHILHTSRNLENVYIPTAKYNAHVPDTSLSGKFGARVAMTFTDSFHICIIRSSVEPGCLRSRLNESRNAKPTFFPLHTEF